MPTIVWLRQDLRIADNPALSYAVELGRPVIPVFIWDPPAAWPPGAASRYWLHQSLAALSGSLQSVGSQLILRQGDSLAVLDALCAATGAVTVVFNRRYEPAARAIDERVVAGLQGRTATKSFNGRLLVEPFGIATQAGEPYKVFTPFWRRCQVQLGEQSPLPAPARLPGPRRWPETLPLPTLGLECRRDWAGGIRSAWRFGEAGAAQALARFLAEAIESCRARRDLPGDAGVSRLSPHLHFGEISPRQIWHAVHAAAGAQGRLGPSEVAQAWLRQLGWREFAYHLLFHFPHTPDAPLRPEFVRFPWQDQPALLARWQRGETGYPIVDAGMRELWTTGWMHNRVRMITASFLTKDLGIHWLAGAQWFWDTLVDADLANNTLGWQWTAGCGADAAPYFRIFNPVTQSRRFDIDGAYLRRWLPALRALEAPAIHSPWAADPVSLAAAGIRLGSTYPLPLVDHGEARLAALARLQATA